MGYILLVEDNQSNADMVIRILTSAGYQVQHTLRGLPAAQITRKERPDLILMDFDLPDIDGRSMILLLKKQLGGPAAPPIVAVTARTGENEMRTAKSYGCSAFIGKPFLPEDLLAVVQRFVPISKQS
jgi:CheY-like chemotaxis protein